MTERMSTFFPSEFTGIAQWIICTIYILSNEKGIRGWKAVALILFALPILVLMNIAHSEQPALIWLVITVCCLESVLIYLRLGIREDFSLILLRWCNAVMQSEFAAALAYAINIYLVSRGVMRFPDIRASQTIMLFCICYYIYSTGHSHLSSLPSEKSSPQSRVRGSHFFFYDYDWRVSAQQYQFYGA